MEECDARSCTLSKLYRWRGLYESYLFGTGFELRRKQRNYLGELWKPTSVVHAKRGQCLPKLGQKSTGLKDSSIDNEFRNFLPPLPFVEVRKRFCRKEVKKKPPEKIIPIMMVPSNLSLVEISTEVTDRPPSLRKPTKTRAKPMKFDEMKKIAGIYMDFQLDCSGAETQKFYQTHFPILVEKLSSIEEMRKKSWRFRTIIQKNKSLFLKRKKIFDKLKRLDEIMADLVTDDDITTELIDERFDPRKWQWNEEIYDLEYTSCSD